MNYLGILRSTSSSASLAAARKQAASSCPRKSRHFHTHHQRSKAHSVSEKESSGNHHIIGVLGIVVGTSASYYTSNEHVKGAVCDGDQGHPPRAVVTSVAPYATTPDMATILHRYASKISSVGRRSQPNHLAELQNKNDIEEDLLISNKEKESSLKNDKSEPSYEISVRALRGGRFHMEDEYFIGDEGRFVAIFDGHGGGGVSTYLREHMYSTFKKYLSVIIRQGQSPTMSNRVAALKAAFNEIDTKVLLDDDLKDQGSTAVCCALQQNGDGQKIILTANVGDSRAILSRQQKAMDLTVDHKPGNDEERARIEGIGGLVEYDHNAGFHRVGNLSVSRAIGDRYARPIVCGEVDIKEFAVDDSKDEFIVLGSDGLFDVMSSQTVVNFIQKRLSAPLPEGFPIGDTELLDALMALRRKNMTKFLAKEAVRRGSMDNISVIIVWLNDNIGENVKRT